MTLWAKLSTEEAEFEQLLLRDFLLVGLHLIHVPWLHISLPQLLQRKGGNTNS